ncbi:hypothetical protein B0H13DRAFT_2442315 [Mycena leptocephala]|nr:hypothetical protein B0H13DRAFT_2442315 [Mycena leptocephala]
MSYSTLLESLRTRVGNMKPLPPSASPGTIGRRRAEYAMTKEILGELQKKMEEMEPEDDSETEKDTTPKDPVLARFEAVVPDPTDMPALRTADEFKKLLLDKQRHSAIDAEDTGFRRLFVGYEDADENWGLSWILTLDFWQRTMQVLSIKDGLDRSVFFVDFVLRQIEILKFIWTWTARDDDKKWKTLYLQAAFQIDFENLHRQHASARAGSQEKAEIQDEIDSAFKKFKKDHANVIKERKNLALLYDHFGPGIFLDQVWDTVGASHICANLPDWDGMPLPLPASTYSPNANSLYRILYILTGSDVVPEYVTAFIQMHPPKEYGEDWTWGLYDEE